MDISSFSPEQQKNALLEAEILKSLNHPYIICFKDVIIENNPQSKSTLNIIMDYANGGDLSQKIREQKETKNKPFPERTILEWFTQICLAIKHIHDRKIIHRDIKSQNIFLTQNGKVKLGDFGIARCLDKTMEKALTVVGTPYYLSPEIINNEPYDFKSDIWSLGVLLYEMCMFKMPFDAVNVPQLYIKIVKGNYQRISSHFSMGLRTLVNDLLNVDSKKRPTIKEILDRKIIKTYIQSQLTYDKYKEEFSHTVLHNFSVEKAVVNENGAFHNKRRASNNNNNHNNHLRLSKNDINQNRHREYSNNNINNSKDDIAKLREGLLGKPYEAKLSEHNDLMVNISSNKKERKGIEQHSSNNRKVINKDNNERIQNQISIVQTESSSLKQSNQHLKNKFNDKQSERNNSSLEKKQEKEKDGFVQVENSYKKQIYRDSEEIVNDFLVNVNPCDEDTNYVANNSQKVNELQIVDLIKDEIDKDIGKEMSHEFSKLIKKYINDDIIFFDYDDIVSKIRNELQKSNYMMSDIEKAVLKIPDIYYLILKHKL
jgi:NIMA (never in mitosis gene a)-related kinase